MTTSVTSDWNRRGRQSDQAPMAGSGGGGAGGAADPFAAAEPETTTTESLRKSRDAAEKPQPFGINGVVTNLEQAQTQLNKKLESKERSLESMQKLVDVSESVVNELKPMPATPKPAATPAPEPTPQPAPAQRPALVKAKAAKSEAVAVEQNEPTAREEMSHKFAAEKLKQVQDLEELDSRTEGKSDRSKQRDNGRLVEGNKALERLGCAFGSGARDARPTTRDPTGLFRHCFGNTFGNGRS